MALGSLATLRSSTYNREMAAPFSQGALICGHLKIDFCFACFFFFLFRSDYTVHGSTWKTDTTLTEFYISH